MMMGPMKKKVVTTGVIAFLIPCIIFGVFFYLYNSRKSQEITNLNLKAADEERYVFSGDYQVNHIVGADDVRLAGVKKESVAYDTYSAEQLGILIGKKLKVPVMNKTLVSSSLFFEDETDVNGDVRTKEFNMISLPSDLQQYDYVDVRILFPTGEDFLVVAGKEVKKLGTNSESNTIFMDLTEEELIRLSGAIIESYISDSVHLYAVKYVDPYQQLFEEKQVDYVEKYRSTVETMLEELNAELNELSEETLNPDIGTEDVIANENYSGEANEDRKTYTEDDLNSMDIATRAGMKLEDVEAIRNAIKKDDTALLAKYRSKIEIVKKVLIENYPVRKEVATLIASNPNIIETLRAKYNVESLEERRINLINTSVFKADEYTGEIKENSEVLSNVASRLSNEIETQKTERKEYLQALIRSSL